MEYVGTDKLVAEVRVIGTVSEYRKMLDQSVQPMLLHEGSRQQDGTDNNSNSGSNDDNDNNRFTSINSNTPHSLKSSKKNCERRPSTCIIMETQVTGLAGITGTTSTSTTSTTSFGKGCYVVMEDENSTTVVESKNENNFLKLSSDKKVKFDDKIIEDNYGEKYPIETFDDDGNDEMDSDYKMESITNIPSPLTTPSTFINEKIEPVEMKPVEIEPVASGPLESEPVEIEPVVESGQVSCHDGPAQGSVQLVRPWELTPLVEQENIYLDMATTAEVIIVLIIL